MQVCSREYKMMLNHQMFVDRKPAAASFWAEVRAQADRIGIKSRGEFSNTKKREIVFLDTPDFTIRHNGFVFRHRLDLEKNKSQYTIKCRSPDRYVAAGAKLGDGDSDREVKLEEDIAVPLVSRFSHSATVDGPDRRPGNLKQAAELFSSLGELERDGEPCSPKLKLLPVNSIRAFERVMDGPVLRLPGFDADVALILWSEGAEGRPLVAEFSFRYRDDKGAFTTKVAREAMHLFSELQRLDWCLPTGRTKTEYVYREG